MSTTQTAVPPPPPPPPPPVLLPADNRSTLYVGDLHPETTENDLHLLFSTIGTVNSVRICRDRFTGKSFCYGYVNFQLSSDAALAISRLNHTEMKGKQMRIMWCEKDPVTRRIGDANLFVKNIHSTITEGKLEEVFGKFGTIVSCKIAKDGNGKSKGFGFVQFDSEDSANNAMGALDGSTLEDKIISVARFLNKSERKEPEFTNVYVKNLDLDFTENLLKEKFSEYGNVTSAVIMKNADGKSRGFGFVNFESPDSAKQAIEALNGAKMGSKEWFVGKAMKKSEREGLLKLSHQKEKTNASNLFVKNLAPSVDEKTLVGIFAGYGNVTETKVIRHKNGVSKGYGFVCFSNPEEAKKACDALNGKFYHGKYMNVTVAVSKEECTRKLQTYIAALQNFGNNQYLPSYYGIQSYLPLPVYDPYWQSNVFNRMQGLPSFNPQSHQVGVHSSYDKDPKPFTTFSAWFSKVSSAKEAHQQGIHMGYQTDQKPFSGFTTGFSKGSLAKAAHQEGVHMSYDKDQKPFTGCFTAGFSKGSLAKAAHQNPYGVKRSRVLLENKAPELKEPRKSSMKLQVKKERVGNEIVFGLKENIRH